jgi:hypothetical protein
MLDRLKANAQHAMRKFPTLVGVLPPHRLDQAVAISGSNHKRPFADSEPSSSTKRRAEKENP